MPYERYVVLVFKNNQIVDVVGVLLDEAPVGHIEKDDIGFIFVRRGDSLPCLAAPTLDALKKQLTTASDTAWLAPTLGGEGVEETKGADASP
jgi:hypothetical protein